MLHRPHGTRQLAHQPGAAKPSKSFDQARHRFGLNAEMVDQLSNARRQVSLGMNRVRRLAGDRNLVNQVGQDVEFVADTHCSGDGLDDRRCGYPHQRRRCRSSRNILRRFRIRISVFVRRFRNRTGRNPARKVPRGTPARSCLMAEHDRASCASVRNPGRGEPCQCPASSRARPAPGRPGRTETCGSPGRCSICSSPCRRRR